MKCNKTETELIDYIYGEMSEKDSAEFKKHVADCPKCQTELAELQHSRQLLRQIPEITPGSIPVPTRSSDRLPWSWVPSGRAGKLIMGIAAAFLFVLVTGSIARMQIHYSNGSFDISLGGTTSSSNTLTADKEKQIVNRIEQKNYQVLNTWLQNFQDQQNREIRQVLTDYSYALKNRQDQQFSALGAELQQFYNHTDQRFKQTDLVLNDLIQTTKYSQ